MSNIPRGRGKASRDNQVVVATTEYAMMTLLPYPRQTSDGQESIFLGSGLAEPIS